MSDNAIYVNASKLASDAKVALRLSELREQLATPAIMSAQERLEWLTGIIKSDNESTDTKLKASDQMNKMQGEYNQRVTATITYEDRLRELVGGDEY
jgi:hypothetical protein